MPARAGDPQGDHKGNASCPIGRHASRRSPAAARKASRHHDETNQPVRSFRALLTHLATLTRNRIHITNIEFDQLTEPTPTQRRAFELLATAIPITLT